MIKICANCQSKNMEHNFLFIQYPKCSTCQKAKRFLDEHQVNYEDRHIVEQTPSVAELKQWLSNSDLPLSKLFNTSGQKYRALGLKNCLKTMSEDEMLECLASDGMLIKRPLLIGNGTLLVGFKDAQWLELIHSEKQ